MRNVMPVAPGVAAMALVAHAAAGSAHNSAKASGDLRRGMFTGGEATDQKVWQNEVLKSHKFRYKATL